MNQRALRQLALTIILAVGLVSVYGIGGLLEAALTPAATA